MEIKLSKQNSAIRKGEQAGIPIYTRGARIRFLGLPTNPNGTIALKGTVINFAGSFDGTNFFTINDYRGVPLYVVPKASQQVIPENGLATAPAYLPIENPALFEGIQFVRPVSNLAELQDQAIEFYFE